MLRIAVSFIAIILLVVGGRARPPAGKFAANSAGGEREHDGAADVV